MKWREEGLSEEEIHNRLVALAIEQADKRQAIRDNLAKEFEEARHNVKPK